jgi:hypothetical protein
LGVQIHCQAAQAGEVDTATRGEVQLAHLGTVLCRK